MKKPFWSRGLLDKAGPVSSDFGRKQGILVFTCHNHGHVGIIRTAPKHQVQAVERFKTHGSDQQVRSVYRQLPCCIVESPH